LLTQWQTALDWNTSYFENHDQPRSVSRFGNDSPAYRVISAKMLGGLLLTLRGTPFIYQGQEYGASSSHFENIQDFNDVETFNYYRENCGKMPEKELMAQINYGSRDNARRPFAWEEKAPYYGFSKSEPWIAVASRAAEINLEKDKKSEKSVFRFYQKLLAIRKESPAIRYGDFKDITPKIGCFVYERTLDKEKITVICNFERAQKIGVMASGELVLSNYGGREQSDGYYAPFEIAVYRQGE
jgi:oligo-1,6-glucosidase